MKDPERENVMKANLTLSSQHLLCHKPISRDCNSQEKVDRVMVATVSIMCVCVCVHVTYMV